MRWWWFTHLEYVHHTLMIINVYLFINIIIIALIRVFSHAEINFISRRLYLSFPGFGPSIQILVAIAHQNGIDD